MSIHHFAVGKIKATVLNDGFENLDEEALGGIFKPMLDDFLQAFRALPQPYHFCFNVLYLESGGERILIDTGMGVEGKPQFGHLLELLQQGSITPDQIDKVIFSHLHMDHAGGLTVDDAAIFSKAEIIVPNLEWEYWLESGQAPAERTQILKTIFQPYTERIRFVEDGDTVAEGVTVIALPGHTPGHCGFLIESQAGRLLHVVDALHLQMQFAFPDISPTYDLQGDVSAKSRRKALERIADEKMLVLSYHVPFPALGHVEHDGAGFTWKPIG